MEGVECEDMGVHLNGKEGKLHERARQAFRDCRVRASIFLYFLFVCNNKYFIRNFRRLDGGLSYMANQSGFKNFMFCLGIKI